MPGTKLDGLSVSDRQTLRDMGGGKDLASPFNEGFSFTAEEYAFLQKHRPALFDSDTVQRLKNWKTWAQTSEGMAFRVR